MFDIGFSELMLIAVVALVVIGPERLPRVARTAGHLLGRLQRYVSTVKSDISREMQLDELRRLQSEMQESARSVEEQPEQRDAGGEAGAHRDGGSRQRRSAESATGECAGIGSRRFGRGAAPRRPKRRQRPIAASPGTSA
jgi:sec-independent protein translocase protein TatB